MASSARMQPGSILRDGERDSLTVPPAGASDAAALRSYPSAVVDKIPTVCLQGARLHAITERQCIDLVLGELDERRGGSITTMNLDRLRRFVRDTRYAARCKRTSIVTADGMPLIWASRLQGTPLPARVTGSNLIWSLSAAAAQRGRSVYLLGGARGTAQKTAAVLSSRHPNLRIVGVSSESIEFGKDERELETVSAAFASAKPDIVYVALGCPKEEELIDRLRNTLPEAWWLGVGISFSFVSGEIPRAPLWMQRAGLEWFHRLLQEPRRLARRYLIHGLPFALTLFCSAALRRFSDQRNLRNP